MNSAVSNRRLKIGEVASVSGLSVKTIRYYEEIGLLSPTVLRAESGYRLFTANVLDRLGFIKQAQSLGLSLADVKELLQLHDRGVLPCGAAKQQLQEKIEQIEMAIVALTQQRSHLKMILAEWNEQPTIVQPTTKICPNLQK